MRAMILAAGRGERMRPLTDFLPKPLLSVGGKPLIVWHLERLAAAGFKDIVINHAHLGQKLIAALGDGDRWGLRIQWSAEPEGALETAGGIAKAMTLLNPDNGNAPFLVINGDIYCDWNLALATQRMSQPKDDLAYLVMVPNPEHHPNGDFVLNGDRVQDVEQAAGKLTFAGIGIYRPALFTGVERGKPAKLAPLLREAMHNGHVSGECHPRRWEDVGTPERLAALDVELTIKPPVIQTP
ncbi:MAG TPA: nucleotidyltransferase family protein [Rhodocyclaceae bacterium]|nr:nucleotidyltransferase family protein [Rhodocyclaceae bacterium]